VSIRRKERRSYTKYNDNNEHETAHALTQVSSAGTVTRNGVSEDEIGLAKETEFAKPEGQIHVTRTFQVN
jgi:hypothetical protein